MERPIIIENEGITTMVFPSHISVIQHFRSGEERVTYFRGANKECLARIEGEISWREIQSIFNKDGKAHRLYEVSGGKAK